MGHSGPRIVHVLGVLAAGGAERFVVNLLCELRLQHVDVGLIVLSQRLDKTGCGLLQSLKRANVPFAVGPTDKVKFRSVLWYRNAVSRMRPDILHLHTLNTELAEFIANLISPRSHPIVRTIHNTVLPNSWARRSALRHNRAAVSIACSAAVLTATRHVVSGRMVHVPNGVDFAWPIRSDDNSVKFKSALNLDPRFFHVVTVGRMDGPSISRSQKGHDVLIRAWKQFRLSTNGARLHLVGDGPLRPDLQALAQEDTGIVFHGICSNVQDWLIASDCFVMPSRWEGLPISAIEAVGTGLPCIFSDIPALKEIAPPLVEWYAPGDQSSLAEAIKHVQERPLRPTRSDIISFRKRFGIQTVAKRYSEVYDKIK